MFQIEYTYFLFATSLSTIASDTPTILLIKISQIFSAAGWLQTLKKQTIYNFYS